MTLLAALALAAAGITAALIVALRPLLVRYALARPNARSSHRTPTPQGGGIAVVAATLAVGLGGLWAAALPATDEIARVCAAFVVLAIVGAIDDIRPLSALGRLLLQAFAVTTVVLASGDARILPDVVPLWLERSLVVFAGVWFVNLVNFMDGIDWITAAETVPIAAAFGLLSAAGVVPLPVGVFGAALLGATLGFAPFNRPAARLFLGDVGSLPIGLLLGWMLLRLAEAGGLAAAILLPLYYLVDATLTLLRRLARGERVWEAHRDHFYQEAVHRNGFSVMSVVARVFLTNLGLAALAAATLVWPGRLVETGALLLGAALVGLLLRNLATPREKAALA